MPVEIRPIDVQDRDWVRDFLLQQFGSTVVVSRGRLHHADQLQGLIGLHDGIPSALLTYDITGDECEVVSLHSARPGHGLGTRLLECAAEEARAQACRRIWLITTNDNAAAIEFYRRRGWKLVAIHEGAIEVSRRLKPQIPLVGRGGVPIRDEIEFELSLDTAARDT